MCALRLLRFMFLMLWLLPSASKTSKNHDNLDDFSAVDQFSDSYARETCAGPERKGLPHKNEVLNALCGEMASIGRWFESEYKIAVQATDNEDREAAQHNLVERANIRVQEIQTLMAIARCFGHLNLGRFFWRGGVREAAASRRKKVVKLLYVLPSGAPDPNPSMF